MQNEHQGRAPFSAIDSYLNQHRVNYVEMISRPPLGEAHNNSNNNGIMSMLRRSNDDDNHEFTPPGANNNNWIPGKKGVAPSSSPAPNRVLPQPQAMNHLPYQANVTMLPTPPPMGVRLPLNTNGRPHQTTTKQTIGEDFEPSSFAFPRLTQWPPPPPLHQEEADRERWRHSEDNGVHANSITPTTERHQGYTSSPQHQQHFLSENDKATYLDWRDNHHFVHTEYPSNNNSNNNNSNHSDNNNHSNNSWWRREDPFHQQHQYHSATTLRVDYPTTTEPEEQDDHRPIKKRSQNAFFVFSSERRGQIRAQQPRIRNSDLNKLLGKEWKDLTDEHRSHYKHRAEILKEQAKQDLYRSEEQQSSSSSSISNSSNIMIGNSLLVSSPPSSSQQQQQHASTSTTTAAISAPTTTHNHHHNYDYNHHYNQHQFYNHHHQHQLSSSPTRFTTATGSSDTNHSSGESNMFTTPRHLSFSSERSHDALFVAANNTSPAADWHSNAGSRNEEEEEEDDDDEDEDDVTNNIEEGPILGSTSTSSPPLATASRSGGGGVMSEIASGAGAAEAEALAGLASSIQQQRNDTTLKQRLPAYKRPGEKPKRVKRPPNAYLLFNRDVRHKILDGNPNLTVAEISKEISERWTSLSEEHKAYYNQEAARLKQRHMDDHPNFIYTRRSKAELEKAGYRSRPSKKRKVVAVVDESSSSLTTNGNHCTSNNNGNSSDKPTVKERDPRGRKKKRLKNPTAPKHPMSGFLFYSISVRSEIVANMPKATVGEISKVIAERWRKLREDERAPWVQRAKEDKERYARQMESFTAAAAMAEEGLDENGMMMMNGNHQGGIGGGGNMSPLELDSHTIATVAQMVNPRGEHLLPPLSSSSSSSSPRHYQVLPATPRNDD